MLNYINTALRKRIPFLIFLILYIFYAFSTYKDFGLTLDEYFVYTRGQYFYTHIRGNDPSVEQAITHKMKGNDNLLFKNSTYPGLLYVFNDIGVGQGGYEQYHLLNLLFASIIFWVVFEFMLAFGASPLIAMLGPIFLFFTPRFLGDIPTNPKDMPYAVVYMTALLAMLLNRKMHPALRVLVIGGLIGGTSSIRQVGLLLIPLYGMFRLYQERIFITRTWKPFLLREVIELCGIGLITFAIIVFSYPYLQADPIHRFLELMEINKNFPWNSTVLYFGESLFPHQRPLLYIPIWILITTPIVFLILSFYPLKKLKDHDGIVLLYLSIFLNMAMYVILNPTVYDGLRHFLYLVPHLSLLAAYATYLLIQNKKLKVGLLALIIAQLLIVGYNYVTLHPYQYVYFNELIGGLPGAQNKFERDYWGASDKEAMIWLKGYLHDNGIKQARIATCSRSASIGYYMPEHIDSNGAINDAEYFVCYGRFGSLKKIEGEVIHTVERQGVTLNTVIKVNKKNENPR